MAEILWNESFENKPGDTDIVAEGPARIRETKKGVRERIEVEHYFGPSEGSVPGAHKFPFGNTAGRPGGVSGRIYINTEKLAIEYYDGSSWKEIADRFPSGTKLLFPMSTPPVGWTKVTDWNDVTIIITSGSDGGSTGGQWKITGLSMSSAGNHQHGAAGEHKHLQAQIYAVGGNNGRTLTDAPYGYVSVGSGTVPDIDLESWGTCRRPYTSSAGSHQHPAAGAHTHSLSHDGGWRPAHLKVICAERD